MPNKSDDELKIIANNICKHVADIKFPTEPSFNLTVSVGVAKYPQHANTSQDLYEKADIAMYKIKNSGKNDYCLYKNE